MAVGSRLILRFGTTSGEKNFTYNYGNRDMTVLTVKNAMQAMIDNGSVFKARPLTMISAKVEVTTGTDFDLSE